MSELPTGWTRTTMAEVAHVRLGKMLDAVKNKGVPVPYLRNVNVRWGSFDLSDVLEMRITADEQEIYSIRNGDVLICEGGEPGRAAVWRSGPTDLKFQKALHRARVYEGVSSDLVALYMRHIAMSGEIESKLSGTTIKHLPLVTIRELSIPLPPAAEQRRIVAKIDSLSGKSNRGRDRLEHIPRLVEKYKQAILAAAFRGDLTREWRSKHPGHDTPAARIEQLRFERERIAGKPPKPKVSDDNGRIPVRMGELPASWARTTLEAVTSPQRLIQYGILKPGPHVNGGIPYVKVMNIRGGRIHLEHIRCTTRNIAEQYRRAAIVTGDILLTIRGTVGRLALVPKELNGGNITQDSVRIAVLDCVERDYVFFYLHSPSVQEYFAANQKGVAVRGINVGDVRPIEIPLPPKEEQRELVRRINAALAWIDRLASEAASARKLIDHLDQAVLAKAFGGELVPQDPNDEPASVLLERIRAERATATPIKRGGRD